MKSKKEYDYDIEEAVTECGLTLKDWETLQELSYPFKDSGREFLVRVTEKLFTQ